MKQAIRCYERSLRPLMILVMTASLAGATTTQGVQTRELRRDGLLLASEVRIGQSARHTSMSLRLTNERSAPLTLSARLPNHGLSFRLADGQGGQIVDDLPWDPSAGDRTLAPGEVLEWKVDLANRPMFRILPGPWGEGHPLRGLLDPLMAHEGHLDLRVSFALGELSLALEPVRLVFDSWLLGRSMRFQKLHEGLDGIAVWDPQHPVNPGPSYVPGMVLVTFHAGIERDVAEAVVARLGLAVAGAVLYPSTRTLSVSVPEGTEEDALKSFRRCSEVQSASLNHLAWVM